MQAYDTTPELEALDEAIEEMAETGELDGDLAGYHEALHPPWDALEIDITGKAELLAKSIRSDELQAEAIDVEIARLRAKRLAAQNRQKSKKFYLLKMLQIADEKKIKTPVATISRVKGRQSIEVDPEKAFDWPQAVWERCCTPQPPKVNKAELKICKEYEKLPGVTIVEGQEYVQLR